MNTTDFLVFTINGDHFRVDYNCPTLLTEHDTSLGGYGMVLNSPPERRVITLHNQQDQYASTSFICSSLRILFIFMVMRKLIFSSQRRIQATKRQTDVLVIRREEMFRLCRPKDISSLSPTLMRTRSTATSLLCRLAFESWSARQYCGLSWSVPYPSPPSLGV